MDKGFNAALLMGLAYGLAPEVPQHGDPRGHECRECRQALGHHDSCAHAWIERLAMHMRDHPACRKLFEQVAAGNGDGLCPRARKLFDKAKALGEARDAAYERTMGGKPGEVRR